MFYCKDFRRTDFNIGWEIIKSSVENSVLDEVCRYIYNVLYKYAYGFFYSCMGFWVYNMFQ